MHAAVVQQVGVYPLSIPLRMSVKHAASERAASDPIVVRVELRGGAVGYGETLPRVYVTGETTVGVLETIENTFVPALLSFHPATFADALDAVESLPWHDTNGQAVPAARAAVELALLDAVLRAFDRDMEAVVRWMGLPTFGRPGSLGHIRYSGVLTSDHPATVVRRLRWMYWGGLRHFKLKVGMPNDRETVLGVSEYLRRPIEKRRASLRVDANGAWSREELQAWLDATVDLPIGAIEQPLAKECEEELCTLRSTRPTWIHDESLVTTDDAKRLIELGVAGGFSIRLSKCGGMIPSLRLAGLARREKVRIQLGCMVGETSILSAAGVRFLEVCPGVEWAEGCFGTFLLAEDVVRRGLRFGLGGRVPGLGNQGWGVQVDVDRLRRLCSIAPRVINL